MPMSIEKAAYMTTSGRDVREEAMGRKEPHGGYEDAPPLPEHVQKMSHGGLACMHCGGEVDEDGYSWDGEDHDDEEDGETGQSDDVEKQRSRAMYGRAMLGK